MPLEFTINGKSYSVEPEDFPADITLNTFIREEAKLFGTKFYCLEGGCGVCTVTVRSYHPATQKYYSRGVNSCLVLLNLCHGWDIVTIEGLGSRHDGYHPLQERLAHFNGTQCGYCSPGMIMNMFSNLEASAGKMTAMEIENSFGGNLCRCTGYRPILDTMKSFATDREYEFVDTYLDIEDLNLCPKAGKICGQSCKIKNRINYADHRVWYNPSTVQRIYEIFRDIGTVPYMLVAGNTAHGVYRRHPDILAFININGVKELHTHNIGNVLELGGNVSLTEMMAILRQASTMRGFEYFIDFLKHLNVVAHIQVRNLATIAGNLMIKHQHNEFYSDIFLLLTTIGARVFIGHSLEGIVDMSLPDFLSYDMQHRIILKVSLPKLDKASTLFGSYKILPRSQNSHAYVNAGFLFILSTETILFSRICFGGINPGFIESVAAVDYLRGRQLFSSETFTQAVAILSHELEPDWILPAPSPEYRRKVALGLFYKFILANAPENLIKLEYKSGGRMLERPLSSGIQSFDTRKSEWPVNKPVRKLEALWQCSGEAHFANDIPYMRDEVWAAFVPALSVHATVAQVDASEALAMPGVIAFYSEKDIPGVNSFVAVGLFFIGENEELFCKDIVNYHSQPVGIVLAKTNELAHYAATKVKILYEHNYGERKIKPTLRDVIGESSHELDPLSRDCDISRLRRIRGYLDMGGQFHFSLETQTTVCIPREDGLRVYPSSQFIDLIQTSIANVLNMKENLIDVKVRRLGGSFGAKISRCNHAAVACALASRLSNRPVRLVQSIDSNIRICGKRNACINHYTVTVNDQGKIQSLSVNFYEDMGYTYNESPVEAFTVPALSNCYERTSSWVTNGTAILTDAPSHTWCRAPGTLEGIAMIENIMEHIARVVGRDPVDVRLNNIPDNEMKYLLPEFIESTEYRQRKKLIDDFNKQNRWRKRGIAISLMRFPIIYFGNISAAVAIYHFDGSVAISHGGVEMGQGINTKATQVAAYTLGIPLEMVTVKATDSFTSANSVVTGGSVTSETVCYAVRKACSVLLERMRPSRDQLTNPTWLEVVRKCHEQHVNLFAREIHKGGDMEEYKVWGLACSEVEVDILTGNFQLTRVDIVEDTGESLSPLIDVGQVEGAFVMGLGYWLTEKLVYDRQTGELKTPNTWHYKVPGAKDIPIDFRVKLYQKRPNPGGILRSKTTGEMAVSMSISAVFALRHALDSARQDSSVSGWYLLGAPTTIEEIVLAAGHSEADYKFGI